MRKLIFHYHLFKNAGTSVDAVLKANFPNGWATEEFDPDHTTNQRQVLEWCQQRQKVRAFSSHTALLPPPNLPDTQVFPILFIRHPIDRIASAYRFERDQEGDNFSIQMARQHSLGGYIDAHLAHDGVGQCRNLQSHRLAQWFHGTDGDLTAVALKALENLPFVGLVEAFDPSVQRMAVWLSPHFPKFKPLKAVKNVSRTPADIEQKLSEICAEIGDERYARLLEANAADMAVYAQVKNRYGRSQIPKTIMQFWHSQDLPDDIASLVDSWRRQHPDFNYRLFNDDTARAYLNQHFPSAYLDAFNSCAIPAMRSDFFRYAFIYNEGGVYVDAGIDCLKPLPDWLDFSQHLILVKKPKGGGRLINGFIAATANCEFLQAVLTQCISNICNQSSNNIWLVTGPGVINAWVKNIAVKPQMQIIEFALFKQNCHIFNRLDHKKTHWSLTQKNQAIYVDDKRLAKTDPVVLPMSKTNLDMANIKLVLIGHPRCGSQSLAKYLTQAGLRVGHERLHQDGVCSWWLTARRSPENHGFLYQAKDVKAIICPELVCHFIRNPIDAIPSILIENEFNQRDNNSFRYRRQMIKRHFGVDIAEHEALPAAALSYVYWNQLASQAAPDVRVKVEDMADDLWPVIDYYGLSTVAKIPRLNTSVKKFGVTEKTAVDSDVLLQAITGKARLYLQTYLSLYDGR